MVVLPKFTMSKIAKIPVKIKEGVTVSLEGGVFRAAGLKGNLSFVIPQGVSLEILDNEINIKKTDDLQAMFIY